MAEHDVIITEAEAARILTLSVRTLQRLRIDGGGPSFIKLTDRRIGYTHDGLWRWVQGRRVASTSEVTILRQPVRK